MTVNIDHVKTFARARHGTQTYAGVSYDYHLELVAATLAEFGFDDFNFQAAAWLHDVIEDTPTSYEEVRELTNALVADMVWAVSGEGENRKIRNATIKAKIGNFPGGCILKCSDRLVNHETSLRSPDLHGLPDQPRCKMYLSEKDEFLRTMYGMVPLEMFNALERQYEELARVVAAKH